MKKLAFLLLIFSFAVHANAQQNFKIQPQKPIPGSVIKFEWLTRNTSLQGKEQIEGTAYLLYTDNKLPHAVPINLKKEGGIVRGSVKTNDSTRAVFFSFFQDDIIENNNDAGYYTLLYDKDGKEIMGGNLALATVFANHGWIWRLKRNADKAAEFYQKEFGNPAAKEKYLGDYLQYLSQAKKEEDKDLFKSELAKMAEKKNIKEADLQRVKSFYERNLKDKEKAADVMTKLKERFPDGLWKRNELVDTFYKEKDAFQKASLFEEIKKGSLAKEDQSLLDNLAFQVAHRFAHTADFENMAKYAAVIKSNDTKAALYNYVAWKQAGEGIHNKPLNLDRGKQLSLESMELLKKEMKEKADKPVYQTDAQYAKHLENTYYTCADTYATLLYHSGEYDKAYEIQKKAVEHYKRKSLEVNTAFTMIVEKAKGKKAAREELEKFFEEGKYTPAMKDQFKAIYLEDNKTEEDWVKYTHELEVKALGRLKEELSKKMINMPAPQFALHDLEGKEVSLASMKGKVVVVDFWATWCGPCVASFPGMKKAVEKYQSNPEVAFVFIDTWEKGEDREKKVSEFMAKNKYPFQVLYDQVKEDEFVVVQQYEVEGIPTKFVIDRNGNIRFKTVGGSSSEDELVNELTVMIDIAAAESGEPLKKAF